MHYRIRTEFYKRKNFYYLPIHVTLGPDALGKFLFILRKNLPAVALDKCARWILDLPNFAKAYQTSKAPSFCLEAGKFLSGMKSDRFVNLHVHTMIWRKMSIKKIWSLFLVGVLKSEAR